MKNKSYFIFLCFLCIISIGGAGLVYWSTARIGPGVSADGVMYLSVAENILNGNGFTNFSGAPFIHWPPLYPILIAIFSKLSGADTVIVGRYINIVIFGLIIFFTGILLKKTYPDRLLFAYIGSIFTALSVAIIDTCSSILSDSLFLLIVVTFLLTVRAFNENQHPANLFGMSCLACLASLERYVGAMLIIVGAIFLIYFYWNRFRQGILTTAIFSLSGLPLVFWMIHNYFVSGSFLSSYLPAYPIGNLYMTAQNILYWFFPYNVIRITTPFGLSLLIVIILTAINRLTNWQRFAQRLIDRSNVSVLIVTVIYLGVLIFYTSYTETNNLGFQRFQIILLVPLLIMLFAAYEELIPPRNDDFSTKIKDYILIGLFMIWLIYPISKLQTYERQIRVNGEIAYNSYNYVNIQKSSFLKAAKSLPTGQYIYSNYEPAAWFYLRQNILSIPRINPKNRQFDSATIIPFHDSIQKNGGGYLVWFNTINYRDNLPTTNQLQKLIEMKPVFTSDIGNIYHIQLVEP